MKTTYAREFFAVIARTVVLLDVFKLKGRCPLQQATATTTNIAKFFETFSAGNIIWLLESCNTNLPEIYSLITDWGFGCPVCMLKPSVHVTN